MNRNHYRNREVSEVSKSQQNKYTKTKKLIRWGVCNEILFLKMKLTKYIGIIQKNDKNIRTYFVLAIVRVLLVFIPQFGYIHPDEFFQSMEVMAGRILLYFLMFS